MSDRTGAAQRRRLRRLRYLRELADAATNPHEAAAARAKYHELAKRSNRCDECGLFEGLHHGTCSLRPESGGEGLAPCPFCGYVLFHAPRCAGFGRRMLGP